MNAIFKDFDSAEERLQRVLWKTRNTSIQKEVASSRMANESESKEEPSETAYETWKPNIFQEEPGYAYYLFTPAVHRAWALKAEETIKRWRIEGNGENDSILTLINNLIACSQGDAYDEGFESDDLHLNEQANARWEQRHELLLTLMKCRNASEMLRKKVALKLGGDNGQFVRAAAFRYNELNCWGDTGEPSEEYKQLKLLLGLL